MKTKIFTIGLACLSFAVTACSNANSQITLKVLENFNGECEINSPIDVGYFFYCSDYKAKAITVTYNKGNEKVTETVNGEIFIPTVSGAHTFTCVAGGQTVTKEVNVVDQKPFISVDSNTYFRVVDPEYPTVYLDDLTQYIACTYSPESAKLIINKVEYASFNLRIDAPEKQYTDIPVSKGESFEAVNKGHYKVHVSAVNGTRTASGVFNVIVDEKINNGNQYVKKVEGKDKYYSTRVVVDNSNPNAFLLPAADYRKGASYVTLKDLYTYSDDTGHSDCHEVVIRFKGKNIPSIGFYTQPGNDSFSNTSITQGYVISWEQNKLTDRYSVVHTSSTYVLKTVYSNHPEYEFGIEDLKDDEYYRLKVGLKSMYKTDMQPTYSYLHCVGWDIERIKNINTPQESYEKLVERQELEYYLPYDAGGWWDNYEDRSGYITFYSSSLKDITFEVER